MFLNYSINYESSNTITEQLLTEFNLGIDLYDSLYLNKKEISELKNYGQIIGSHSFDHQVLSTLSKDDQSSQIEHSLNALRHYMPEDLKTFCYPYGYKMSYNKSTIKILNEFNFDYAFVFDNKKQVSSNKFEISRLDCNKF